MLKISRSSKYSGSDLRRAWIASTAVRSWKSKWVGWERADLRARMLRLRESGWETSFVGMVRRARRR